MSNKPKPSIGDSITLGRPVPTPSNTLKPTGKPKK